VKKFNKKDYLIFGGCILLTIFAISYNQKIIAENQIYFPRPLTDDDIKLYSNTDNNAVLVFPDLTNSAYQDQGFYPHNGTLETYPLHDTIKLVPGINATYLTGLSGYSYLVQLHYPVITDTMIDQHPDILKQYNKVILLHNEYMTTNEFNAISTHKNVIYLYPNSAYAQVTVDYKNWTMSLVRGHHYPTKDIENGFGFVTSSHGEYDLNCKNYKWVSMPNGMQLSCWGEFLIKSDRSVLQTIKDFPSKMPNLISAIKPVNMTIPRYDYTGNCISNCK